MREAEKASNGVDWGVPNGDVDTRAAAMAERSADTSGTQPSGSASTHAPLRRSLFRL